MPVQKLNTSSESYAELQHQNKGFTTHLNAVIENIPDSDMLALYIYLSSKPPGWQIINEQLMKHFGWGDNRTRGTLAKLKRAYLLEDVAIRGDHRVFKKWTTYVKDGIEFLQKYVNNQQTPTSSIESLLEAQPLRGKQRPSNKRDISNEREKQREAAPQKARRSLLSPSFVPSSENQKRLQETAQKANRLEGELLQKFKNLQRSKQNTSADWDAELENFLMNERPASNLGNFFNNPAKQETAVSTAGQNMFWGKGHPAWEEQQRFEEKRKARLAEEAQGQQGALSNEHSSSHHSGRGVSA